MQAGALGRGLVVPGGHGSHARSRSAEPGTLTKVPCSQAVHAAHLTAFELTENVPSGHGTHCPASMNVPGRHSGTAGGSSLLHAQSAHPEAKSERRRIMRAEIMP